MRMITKTVLSSFLLLCLITGCKQGTEENLFRVLVSNGSDLEFTDHLFGTNITDLRVPDSLLKTMNLVSDEAHPFQLLDDDRDGVPDKLLFLADLDAREGKSILALPGAETSTFPQRTQAEISVKTGGHWEGREYKGGTFQNLDYLRVPDEHTDHSYYIRYEGPGWESDRVGYRFYLDWRNAIDIFGKKTEKMVLQDVGQDGFDSYHEPGDWGMDILKVGESLGIGSLAIWHDGRANRVAETDSITCEIIASGPIYSEIETNYYGWQAGTLKTDLISRLSITAGSRMTKHEVWTSRELDNLCTGIVIDAVASFLYSENAEGWSYMASYGPQSLAGDNLGMAVLYRSEDLIELTEDAYSKVVVLKPSGNVLTYYFLAAWEKEPDGIRTQEEFLRYLNETISRLNNPPEVKLML